MNRNSPNIPEVPSILPGQSDTVDPSPRRSSLLRKSLSALKDAIPSDNPKLAVQEVKERRASQILINNQDDFKDTFVTSEELQSLLDEEVVLRKLLGTGNATAVIRRFAVPADDGKTTEDPVAQLQKAIFKRLDVIEKAGLDLNFREVPLVKDLSAEISLSLFQMQNDWRTELARILEISKNFDTGVESLTTTVNQIISNHNRLSTQLVPRQ
jgi:hypothetical protein